MLVRAGVDVNQADNRGRSPLNRACKRRHTVVAEALLRRGANPNEVWEGYRWMRAREVRARVIQMMGGLKGVERAFSEWASKNRGRNTKSATKTKSLFFGDHFPHIAAALFQMYK